jgi:pimeloyl-ACP methyl ester carboxylesterase
MSANPQDGSRPTVVLVHGAFAESASWNDVIGRLQDQGYTVIAAANPIRSVAGDAEFVASIFEAIEGPIVAVGHSYGGTVITNAARDNVKALVYVAGYAPEEGENALELSARFPGATLGATLWTVPLSDGSNDLYIRQEEYHQQFAEDVTAEQTALMAVGQRPLRDVAANEASGVEVAPVVVRVWGARQEHPRGIPPLHGRARRGPRDRGDRGRLPRGGRLAPRGGGRHHPPRG